MKLGKGPSNPFGWGLHNLHLHGIQMCAVVLLAWNCSTLFNPIVPRIEGNISRNPLFFWLLVWRPMANQSPITNPMMGFLVNSYQLTRWHQRWCSDPPFSMKCYGDRWRSMCEECGYEMVRVRKLEIPLLKKSCTIQADFFQLVVLVISRRAVSGVLLHFYVDGLWNREHLQPMLQNAANRWSNLLSISIK